MGIRDNILRTKDSDRIPIVMVGTRYDKQAERVITLEDAKNLAKICDAPYVEVDTTSGHGMEDVYSTTVRRVAQFNEPQHRPTPKK
jgi:GTPase SAR1 family protein